MRLELEHCRMSYLSILGLIMYFICICMIFRRFRRKMWSCNDMCTYYRYCICFNGLKKNEAKMQTKETACISYVWSMSIRNCKQNAKEKHFLFFQAVHQRIEKKHATTQRNVVPHVCMRKKIKWWSRFLTCFYAFDRWKLFSFFRIYRNYLEILRWRKKFDSIKTIVFCVMIKVYYSCFWMSWMAAFEETSLLARIVW